MWRSVKMIDNMNSMVWRYETRVTWDVPSYGYCRYDKISESSLCRRLLSYRQVPNCPVSSQAVDTISARKDVFSCYLAGVQSPPLANPTVTSAYTADTRKISLLHISKRVILSYSIEVCVLTQFCWHLVA